MRKKVVLYNPQAVFHTMPLALLAVGSRLDSAEWDVVIVDARLEADPHARVLAESRDATCLGMSVLTGAPLRDALTLARRVKTQYPDLPVVWGGWHPSLFPTETLADPSVDVTVSGQGEATFVELAERLADGAALDGVPGLCFRHDGDVRQNPARPIQDMNTFALPDFELIDVERFFELKGCRQLDYISSVGCHFRCAFCADPFVYNRSWNGLSAERVGEDIETLWRRYRFDDLNFQDETFFTYRDRVAGIAEAFLRRGLRFSWAATMRADQGVRLSEETFALCVRSGMRRVLIGVESGSPDMLVRIAKDTTIEQIFEAAAMCARHDVAVIFSFIIGFPGERPDQVRATLDVVKRLRAMSPRFETPIFYYKPYPGSALAVDVPGDVPRTLEDWADFDYVGGPAGPWVTPGVFDHVERFKFYNRFAWGPETWRRRPLQLLARWRCRNDYYGWPVEKLAVDRWRPSPELS